jgi:hypothetical protein
LKKIDVKRLFAMDSTTITLFKDHPQGLRSPAQRGQKEKRHQGTHDDRFELQHALPLCYTEAADIQKTPANRIVVQATQTEFSAEILFR